MIDFEQGILNRGDWGKIRRVMEKAADGEEITLAFLGGSITQGSLSSTPETCYAYLVYRWWTEQFPKAKITYINAGIGGTTSQFGAARVHEDVLRYRPDFVLTEFAVNDDDTPHFRETYEGLIRTIVKSGAALLLMNNVCYDSGNNAQAQHLPVAQHYRLPMVSIRHTVYPALQRGELQNRQITPDDLHPNDAGHALVAQAVCHMLEKIRTSACKDVDDAPLPAPITENRYEQSTRYQNHNANPVCRGFVPDETPQTHITQTFRRGFTAWNTGDSITFSIVCSCVGVQYRKSVQNPTPIAKITVDGQYELVLDGNFDETWGDCLYLDTVCEGLERKEHTVHIRIVESHENDAVPFYLVSVIGS